MGSERTILRARRRDLRPIELEDQRVIDQRSLHQERILEGAASSIESLQSASAEGLINDTLPALVGEMERALSHPSKDITGTRGDELKAKKIVLGVTGSISAYRAPDIARALMRHGADVYAVMTQGALKIIQPSIMEWATGNSVVTELTGRIEHVEFTTGPGKADLILVAPATANTIGKIASGIDDTPVTSYVSSALGAGVPVMIAPAMHDTMIDHPIIKENMEKLHRSGIYFVSPVMEEGKAKLAGVDSIVTAVIGRLGGKRKDMSGIRVLITAGPTVEPIDAIRVLTNRSSGKMGIALAREAVNRGATVTLVYGPGSATPPQEARVVRVNTADEMYQSVKRELAAESHDITIATAAVSDYRPVRVSAGKISSAVERMSLELERTPKIIEVVKKVNPSTFLVIFKAEHSLSEAELLRRAARRGREVKANMVVVNDVGKEGIGFGTEENEVMVLDSSGLKKTRLPRSSKSAIAGEILTLAVKWMTSK